MGSPCPRVETDREVSSRVSPERLLSASTVKNPGILADKDRTFPEVCPEVSFKSEATINGGDSVDGVKEDTFLMD
jgi:hypothetical protein